jgi:hypothetical protein
MTTARLGGSVAPEAEWAARADRRADSQPVAALLERVAHGATCSVLVVHARNAS